MDLRDGNRKKSSGRRHKKASPKLGHGIGGSRNPYRIHSSICGFTARQSETLGRSQFYSSKQNFEPYTGKEFCSRNGFDYNFSRSNSKNPVSGFYLLDEYPRGGYIRARRVREMETEDGRTERNDRSNHIETRDLPRYIGIRSRVAHRSHTKICRFKTRESGSPCECQRNSTEQNFKSHQGQWISARNGNNSSPRKNYPKHPITKYFLLDKYLDSKYFNHNNYPTKNKKARLQPGSELDKSPTTDFCLSPLLFAVNQKF